jgi:hypothetical protein
MNNRGVYILAAGLILGLIALVVAGVEITSGIAVPTLGKAVYIWGGAGIVLLAVIAFFLWLIKKGGADTP